MSIDPPSRWINYVVWAAGGRHGWLGHWYVPTLQEEARERHYALQRRLTEIDMSLEEADRRHESLVRATRRYATDGNAARAREKATDVAQCERTKRRLRAERRLVENESAAVERVRDGNAVQESVLFRARALTERFADVPPQRMARVLARIEQLQSFDTMTDDMIDSMYADEDERADERERERDERDGDAAEAVLEELGLVASVEAAPAVPATPPGALGAGERT